MRNEPAEDLLCPPLPYVASEDNMESVEHVESTIRVLEDSLSQIKWRLKVTCKYRLQTDILALCTGMRPVVMVDYGGKMPELGHKLDALLNHCKKENSTFEHLRVMVIDDMVYLIHVIELATFVNISLNLETEMLYADLETDPPKMITRAEKSPALMQLLTAEQLFSSIFHVDGVISDMLQSEESHNNARSTVVVTDSCTVIDLSYCLQKTQVTIPTLNGWLLGYPVVYLFGVDCIERAISNLSTKSLHVYQFFVKRAGASRRGTSQEELMSFTVPYELSLEGSNEPWAKSFLANMQEKLGKCKYVWESLHMEVSSRLAQAIAL